MDSPDEFVVQLEGIYPVNKGTSAYTSFETGSSGVMMFLMEHEQFMDMKQGYIHSHNKMKVFFSGTDMQELEDNCGNHNYYLSVIVNNAGEICAKIAVHSKESYREVVTRNYFDGKGKEVEAKYSVDGTREVMEHYDCNVQIPEVAVPEWFSTKVAEIIEASLPKKDASQLSLFSNFGNKAITRPTPASFVPKFIALDLSYNQFTYDALLHLEAMIEAKDYRFTVSNYTDAFDTLFDEHFASSDISPLDVLLSIEKQVRVYETHLPEAYSFMMAVLDELTEGIDEDEYDLTNPNNNKFYGR